MIKFKGRLQFRQYLPSKPIKWGIKVWALAESSTGYLSRCQIYTGKEGGRQENGLSHRVVMDLVRYLSGSHATIFMDNFYTSVKLLQDMLAIGLHGCDTVRANRKGLPTTLLPKNIKRHSMMTSRTASGSTPSRYLPCRTTTLQIRWALCRDEDQVDSEKEFLCLPCSSPTSRT